MTTKIRMIVRPVWSCGRTVLALFLFWLLASPVQAYTVAMSEQDIEAMIAASFPIKQQMPLLNVEFSAPHVKIVPPTSRLRVSMAMVVYFPNQSFSKGRATIEGDVEYDADKGEFHLRQPGLVGLEFEQLPNEYRELVAAIVNTFAAQRLPIIVLYRLDEKDFRQAMARRVLRGITLKDGKLYADLEWK